MVTERCMLRITNQPGNLWTWYELAKSGIKLDEALTLAKKNSWAEFPVRQGYKELKEAQYE